MLFTLNPRLIHNYLVVLTFDTDNKIELISLYEILNTKIESKQKNSFYAVCSEARGNIFCHKPVLSLKPARSRCRPNATRADRFQLNNTSCQVVFMDEGRRKTPWKCCNLIARENTVFFFIYLFSFRTVDSQHPTTPTLLSCKFKKGKSWVFRCEFKTFF